MLFNEDDFIVENQDLLAQVEAILALLEEEYSKTLANYYAARDSPGFEELEPQFFDTLAKMKKAIENAIEFKDVIASILKEANHRRQEKASYFISGVVWALRESRVSSEREQEILASAKDHVKKPLSQ